MMNIFMVSVAQKQKAVFVENIHQCIMKAYNLLAHHFCELYTHMEIDLPATTLLALLLKRKQDCIKHSACTESSNA